MTKIAKKSNQIEQSVLEPFQHIASAKAAVLKFFLRELIIFLLEKRAEFIGDAPIIFSNENLSNYLQNLPNIGHFLPLTDNLIKQHLVHLKDFKIRDQFLKIINPQIALLEYQLSKRKFIVNCSTEYLSNCLRLIDISIYLKERPGKYKNKSLFSITGDHKLKYLDNVAASPLGNKEYAIFNYLRKHFNKQSDYKKIFEAAKQLYQADRSNSIFRIRGAKEKKVYINNGITELKLKLREISGNPNTIETIPDRTSKYKLIY